jgi:hypothetical protein
MRPYLILALVALGLSACSDDTATGNPGVHPDIGGRFVGQYQETRVLAAETVVFQCDMRIDVLDQFESNFIADVFFLEGQDCAQEVLWAEATSGTIDLDGNVALTWDNSTGCNTFDGDTKLVGTLVGDVLSLTAVFECDGWSFTDTYTGDRS